VCFSRGFSNFLGRAALDQALAAAFLRRIRSVPDLLQMVRDHGDRVFFLNSCNKSSIFKIATGSGADHGSSINNS